jgi:GH24 family phage-related lysozyme (muramidase)
LQHIAYRLLNEKYYSIGYGHYGPDVYAGQTCTTEQAVTWRNGNLQSAWITVDHHVVVPLKQGQVDALTDFVYNCGGGTFEDSTFLKELNNGNYSAVPAGLRLYVHGEGNQILGGLVRRRNVEITWWNAS